MKAERVEWQSMLGQGPLVSSRKVVSNPKSLAPLTVTLTLTLTLTLAATLTVTVTATLTLAQIL